MVVVHEPIEQDRQLVVGPRQWRGREQEQEQEGQGKFAQNQGSSGIRLEVVKLPEAKRGFVLLHRGVAEYQV
jgi:hypothetical protein